MSKIEKYFKDKALNKTAKKPVINLFDKFMDSKVVARLKELGKDLTMPKAHTKVEPFADRPISFGYTVQGGQLSLYDEHLKPITFQDETELKL